MDDGHPAELFTRLRDMVLQRVRSDIVAGHAGPGTMFSVPTLAEELGISTTPVREALLELSHVGLLTPVRNRGFRVEETTPDQLRHNFTVRELLERHAMVTLAEQRLTEAEDLHHLADAVTDAVAHEDGPGYLQADRAFHQALITRAGNPLLTRLVMELRDGMRLYGLESAAGRQRQLASTREHKRLITLAEAGDTEGIAALITRHIMDWQPIAIAALTSRTGGGPLRSRRR
jgi:DNA-binding GntR family transcriptional regulator